MTTAGVTRLWPLDGVRPGLHPGWGSGLGCWDLAAGGSWDYLLLFVVLRNPGGAECCNAMFLMSAFLQGWNYFLSTKRNWVDLRGIAVHIWGEAFVIVGGEGGVEHCQANHTLTHIGIFYICILSHTMHCRFNNSIPKINILKQTSASFWVGVHCLE